MVARGIRPCGYTAGSHHFWSEELDEHAAIDSADPLPAPAAARHSPAALLTSVWLVPGVQTWVVLEPQVFRTTAVPPPVACPAVSRHRPLNWRLPLACTVATCCCL